MKNRLCRTIKGELSLRFVNDNLNLLKALTRLFQQSLAKDCFSLIKRAELVIVMLMPVGIQVIVQVQKDQKEYKNLGKTTAVK